MPINNPKQFMGCKVGLTSSINLTTSPFKFSFNKEYFDHGNFWDISDPTKLIIPNGVNFIELNACVFSTLNTGSVSNLSCTWFKNNTLFASNYSLGTGSTVSMTTCTGVLDVIENDYLELEITMSAPNNRQLAYLSYVALNVLG